MSNYKTTLIDCREIQVVGRDHEAVILSPETASAAYVALMNEAIGGGYVDDVGRRGTHREELKNAHEVWNPDFKYCPKRRGLVPKDEEAFRKKIAGYNLPDVSEGTEK